MKNSNSPSLGSCLAMDAVGCASFLIPGLGEGLDIIWAFIAAAVFRSWFKSSIGSIGAAIEEILPFTDIIPAFTIGYFVHQNSSHTDSSNSTNRGNLLDR